MTFTNGVLRMSTVTRYGITIDEKVRYTPTKRRVAPKIQLEGSIYVTPYLGPPPRRLRVSKGKTGTHISTLTALITLWDVEDIHKGC